MAYSVNLHFAESKSSSNEKTQREARAILEGVAKAFGGFTLMESSGGWVAPSGKLVLEASFVLNTVSDKSYDSTLNLARMFAEDLRHLFDQDSVMITITEIKTLESSLRPAASQRDEFTNRGVSTE